MTSTWSALTGFPWHGGAEEYRVANEVQLKAVNVVASGDLLDDLELALPDLRVGKILGGDIEIQRGEPAQGVHQKLRMLLLPGGQAAPDEAVVNVVHADRSQDLHAMRPGKIDDDLQGAPAGPDQLLHVGGDFGPVGGRATMGVAVDGLDLAVVYRSVGPPPQDGPGDGIHLGPGQGLQPALQESFRRAGVVAGQLVAVVVEDDAALPGGCFHPGLLGVRPVGPRVRNRSGAGQDSCQGHTDAGSQTEARCQSPSTLWTWVSHS